MKDKYIRIVVFICFCIIILSSCKEEMVYEGIKGDIKGDINLYGGDEPVKDFSGVTVTAEGSEPLLSVMTNEQGEYTLKDLKTGLYDIVFSKEGFGTYKIISFQFIGGNIATNLGSCNLYRLSNVKALTLKIDTGRYNPYFSYVVLSGTIPDQKTCSFRYYISDDPKVSYLNYKSTSTIDIYNNTTFLTLLSNSLLSMFTQGKQLYLILYPNNSTWSSYLDISSGRQIYDINPNLGSSVISFKVPETINPF